MAIVGDTAPPLVVRDVSKRFAGTTALDRVSMSVGTGECVALVGHNGAGKSTLVKIVTGVHPSGSYQGSVSIAGHEGPVRNVRDAQRLGVAVVQQELTIIGTLTVAENLLIGRHTTRAGLIRADILHEHASQLLHRMGIDVDPRASADSLGLAQQQMLEIARAVDAGARLLLLDEPTSSLTSRETETLFRTIRQLAADGVGIVYISHRLDELDQVADRTVVLRNGRVVLDAQTSSLGRGDLLDAMLGEGHNGGQAGREAASAGRPDARLRLRGWTVPRRRPAEPEVRAVTLEAGHGEIVGIYGAAGSGRSELLLSMYGARKASSGVLTLDGAGLTVRSPRDAQRAGIGFVSEDRRSLGLQPHMTAAQNITLGCMARFTRAGLTRLPQETAIAERVADDVGLPRTMLHKPILALSGGNQQKALLARALAARPRVLLLDEPTRGVDVGARAEINRSLRSLAVTGLTVVWASSEPEELLEYADRIVVLRDGEVVGDWPASEADVPLLTVAASGTRAVPNKNSEDSQ
jgi:ABC-type sugar transport system ATPase subunit